MTATTHNGAAFDAAFKRLDKVLKVHGSITLQAGDHVVLLSSLMVCPALFAARSSGAKDDCGVDQHHVREMLRTLRNKPIGKQFFDRLTVFSINADDYVIDGYHRIEAYRMNGNDNVPVRRVAFGNLKEAVWASVAANSKLQLPMTASQRLEAAWKLIKIGQGSKAEQARLTGTSEAFVAECRRMKTRLQESHPNEDWGTLRESKAKDQQGRFDATAEEWTDEMTEAEVGEIVKILQRHLGQRFHTRFNFVVRAIVSMKNDRQAVFDALREMGDEYGDLRWGEDLDDDIDNRWEERDVAF